MIFSLLSLANWLGAGLQVGVGPGRLTGRGLGLLVGQQWAGLVWPEMGVAWLADRSGAGPGLRPQSGPPGLSLPAESGGLGHSPLSRPSAGLSDSRRPVSRGRRGFRSWVCSAARCRGLCLRCEAAALGGGPGQGRSWCRHDSIEGQEGQVGGGRAGVCGHSGRVRVLSPLTR